MYDNKTCFGSIGYVFVQFVPNLTYLTYAMFICAMGHVFASSLYNLLIIWYLVQYVCVCVCILSFFCLQGMGSFSGHVVTMFVIHLLQSHKISSQMSPYQVFRNAVLNISEL